MAFRRILISLQAPNEATAYTPARQGAAPVEDANDVAVNDAALACVVWLHARDLAAAMFGVSAVAAEVKDCIGEDKDYCARPRHNTSNFMPT
jgi:hypothetical protein